MSASRACRRTQMSPRKHDSFGNRFLARRRDADGKRAPADQVQDPHASSTPSGNIEMRRNQSKQTAAPPLQGRRELTSYAAVEKVFRCEILGRANRARWTQRSLVAQPHGMFRCPPRKAGGRRSVFLIQRADRRDQTNFKAPPLLLQRATRIIQSPGTYSAVGLRGGGGGAFTTSSRRSSTSVSTFGSTRSSSSSGNLLMSRNTGFPLRGCSPLAE